MLSVMIADNQPIALRGLRALLDNHPEYSVIGEAVEGFETLAMVEKIAPSLLILDLEMPGLLGFEVAQRVSYLSINTRIVIYSGYVAYPYVKRAFESNSVYGYVHKDDSDEHLLYALDTVKEGSIYMSPGVMNMPIHSGDNMYYFNLYCNLTNTEKELLDPLAKGYTALQIAEMRSVEESTIRSHLDNLKQKISADRTKISLENLRQFARICLILGPKNLLNGKS